MLEWYSKEWQVFLYPKSQMPHGEVERFHNQSSSAAWVPELPRVRGEGVDLRGLNRIKKPR